MQRAIQLPVRVALGDAPGTQTPHRPERLQQGLHLRGGLLPQLCLRHRRQVAQAGGGEGGRGFCRPAGTAAARAGAALECADHGRGRHRGVDGGLHPGHGRAPGRQGLRHLESNWPGAKIRRCHQPCAHRRDPGRHSRRAHRRRRRRPAVGVRLGGLRLRRGPVQVACRTLSRHRQRQPGAHFRFHRRPRCRVSGGGHEKRHCRGDRGGQDPVHQRHRHRDGAVRRRHRREPVFVGLRLPAGSDARRGGGH